MKEVRDLRMRIEDVNERNKQTHIETCGWKMHLSWSGRQGDSPSSVSQTPITGRLVAPA